MATLAPTAVKLGAEAAPLDWPRIRFAISLAIYGSALGIAVTFTNLLTQFEYFEVPERLPLGQAVLFGTAGLLAGALLCFPFAYLIYGVRPTFSEKGRQPRRLWAWLAIGLAYGMFFPMLLGGIFLPFSQYLMLFFTSIISVPQLIVKIFDLFSITWYSLAIVNGFKLIYTGIVGGILFGPGAWVIDRFNTSADPTTARYGAWVVSIAFAIIVIAFVQLAPTSLLNQIG